MVEVLRSFEFPFIFSIGEDVFDEGKAFCSIVEYRECFLLLFFKMFHDHRVLVDDFFYFVLDLVRCLRVNMMKNTS